VAVLAVGFSGIDGGQANASQDVFSARYRFKMCRVATCAIAAKMIKLQAFWNSTDEKLVSDPMGVNVLKNWIPTKTIANLGNRFCPYPAFALDADPRAHVFGEFAQHYFLSAARRAVSAISISSEQPERYRTGSAALKATSKVCLSSRSWFISRQSALRVSTLIGHLGTEVLLATIARYVSWTGERTT
jgi:hypothetical protein